METRDAWSNTLKNLRQSGDTILLSALSNIQAIFTHDTIVLLATNKGVFEILNQNKEKLKPNNITLEIKQKKHYEEALTTEKKLLNFFGDKITVLDV